MLNKIKRHRFLISFIGFFCVCILKAIYYYANGQSIASAHLDGHYFASLENIFATVILTVVFLLYFAIKKRKPTFKWFSIPAIIIAFVPLHMYIGTLFDCCVGG